MNMNRYDGNWLGDTFIIMGIVAVLALIAISPAFAESAEERIGFLETSASSFCMRTPIECPAPATETMATESQRSLLEQVREIVASTTTWTSDKAHYDRNDWWTLITDGRGDCEDYALTERSILHSLGVPFGTMRLVEAEMFSQDRHMLLEVRFANGDVEVFDSARDEVYSADDIAYWPEADSAWGAVTGWKTV